MDYKDTIIDELKKENYALRNGPNSYDGALLNLHTAEDTLAVAIGDKNRAEVELRSVEDANSKVINTVDAERGNLLAIQRDRDAMVASLAAELNALKAAVAGKRGDLGKFRADFDAARAANTDMKQQWQMLTEDIARERSINNGLRIELGKVDDSINYKTGTVEYGLRGDIARSKEKQIDLDAKINVVSGDVAHTDAGIYDKNGERGGLLSGIDAKNAEIGLLSSKINAESGNTYQLSKDNNHFAMRNSDLSATISALRVRLDDGHAEIAALQASIADLSAANRYKEQTNYVLENNINGLTNQIDSLAIHNRNIDTDVHHFANREAYLKGNYLGANYLHSKQRAFDDDLRASANHVEYVRASSPARSPRRFY